MTLPMVRERVEGFDLDKETVLHSESKYVTLVEHSNDGIIIILDGRLVFVNRKMLELTAYSMAEVIGKPFVDFITPKYKHTVADIHQDRMRGKTVPEVYTAEIAAGNGKVLTIEINASLIKYEGKPATMAIVRDITEQNKVSAELRARETQLSFIYDNISDIIFVIDVEPDGRFRFKSVNQRFLATTGLAENQIIGKLVPEIIPEASQALVISKYKEAIETKHPVHWEEISEYPSGTKYGEVTVSPAFDANGVSTQLVGTVHDITERKQADAELAKYREHLEQLVEKRTEELAKKNAELEKTNLRLQEVDRLKSVFLASMSHELRTPLNSIIGFTSIILQGMTGPVNDEQKKQLIMVKHSANHLLDLINDILDTSKIEAGKVDLILEEFKFNDVIQEVAESFATAAREKNLALIVESPRDILLYSDRRRIKQILLNLISNAIKFTEKGSVRIGAKVANDRLECNIIDTGKGIAAEDIPRLFQPFQQVDLSLIKKYQGTGLGLYLCKRLLDLLGGSISVKSKLDQGSTFTFRVPLKQQEESRK